MTGPNDSHETRPISVAELLARNGTIGAPPIGGRRRRRRGNTDAVTVAELTGEIPIIGDEHPDHLDDDDDIEPDIAEHAEPEVASNGIVAEEDGADTTPSRRVDEPEQYTHDPERYSHDPEPYSAAELDVPDPRDPDEGRRDAGHRGNYRPFGHKSVDYPARDSHVTAEEMRPDPVDEDRAGDAAVDDAAARESDDDLPAYLRTTQSALFGGDMGDDLGRGTPASDAPTYTTTADDLEEEPLEPPSKTQALMRGGLIVVQSIVAVAFGAGLFLAFDELWQWNNIVALVLSVLVILGLVVAVRVVRKTEDIGSTLIAVAVGALVTLGPLALLQSG